MAIQTTIEVLRIPGTLFPRGAFDENASYKFLNIVESGGSGYVCLQPCTGIPVTNTAYWFKFCFKGDKGDAFTYADLTAEQKAELVRDATAAAQAAASSAQSAADDAAAALQKFNTIKAAIDAIDPQSTEGSIQTLAAKQGLLEADLNALGPKIDGVLDALSEKEESLEVVATKTSFTQYTYYGLEQASVRTLDGTTYKICGIAIPCEQGEIYKVYTHGGASAARAYGICDSNGNILEVQDGAIDSTVTPIEVHITQSNAAYLYVNCFGKEYYNSFKVEKLEVDYGEIKQPVFKDEYDSAIETLNLANDSQDETIADIQDELTKTVTEYQDVATTSDLDDTEWYNLTSSSKVTIQTNMTYGIYGYKMSVQKGDVFLLSTYGGVGNGRAYAIATSDGTILEVATTEERDMITNPKVINISYDDAAYLYANHYVSNGAFSLKRITYVSKSKLDDLTERVEQLEEVPQEDNHLIAKSILLIGASFAYDQNTWFEQACEKLGFTAINKAVSGSKIHADAVRMMNGTLFTDINSFDILAMMHVHNYNIGNLDVTYKGYSVADYEADATFVDAMNNGTATSAWYAAAFDYVIKKYQTLCYAEKDNAESPWYGTASGKPCVIVMCTSWHDARQTYNTAAKTLAEKWGMYLCNFADNIGFSCQRLNAATGAQPSIIFANETTTETFSIDGTSGTYTVGWHPLRGRSQYIQQKMAKIFADCVREHLW